MQDKWPEEIHSRLLLMGQDYWNSSEAGRGRLGEKKKASTLSKIETNWDLELKVLKRKSENLLRSIWLEWDKHGLISGSKGFNNLM